MVILLKRNDILMNWLKYKQCYYLIIFGIEFNRNFVLMRKEI